jgi:hypothetical protein
MLEAFDAGTLGAVVAGIGEDLAADLGTDKFQVDLAALNDYYHKVYGLLERLNEYGRTLPQNPYAQECIETSGIPGVAKAIEATVNNALGDTNSMLAAVNTVRGNLGMHLNALADVYTAYVKIDHQNATELTQAGAPDAAKINLPLVGGSPSAGTGHGWASTIITGTNP